MMNEYRIDDLQIKGLKIKQNTTQFCFGMDAVLLADFAAKRVRKAQKVIDLGCGNGIIPLLLTAKANDISITGLEINRSSADLAKENVSANRLEGVIEIIEGDIKNVSALFIPENYDAVVTNPPYIKLSDGKANEEESLAAARHETLCSLADVLRASKTLLKFRGAFFMIHRSHRLAEIIDTMRQHHIEPKEIRFIHPRVGEKSNLVLLKGIKGGSGWVDILPPLFVYDKNDAYTQEIHEIYNESH